MQRAQWLPWLLGRYLKAVPLGLGGFSQRNFRNEHNQNCRLPSEHGEDAVKQSLALLGQCKTQGNSRGELTHCQ